MGPQRVSPDLTKRELLALAEERGVAVSPSMNKAQLVARINKEA